MCGLLNSALGAAAIARKAQEVSGYIDSLCGPLSWILRIDRSVRSFMRGKGNDELSMVEATILLVLPETIKSRLSYLTCEYVTRHGFQLEAIRAGSSLIYRAASWVSLTRTGTGVTEYLL